MNKSKDQMRKDTTNESRGAGGEGPEGKAARHVIHGREQPGKQRTRTGTSGGEAALDWSVQGSRRNKKRRQQETARRARTRARNGGEREQEEQEVGGGRKKRRRRGGQAHGTRTGTSGEATRPDWSIRGAKAHDWNVRGRSGPGLERPGQPKEEEKAMERSGEETLNEGKQQMRKDAKNKSREAG